MKKFFSLLTLLLAGASTLTLIAQDNPCGVEGIVVEASNYVYSPASVEIEAGQTIVWVNVGGSHDVNGSESSIGAMWDNPEAFSLPTVSGNSDGVCIGSHTFTVEGTYDYDCSVGNHAQNGMVATVTVNPAPQSNSVVDIIVNSQSFTMLEDALVATDLIGVLNGEGPFTVFAPTDDAHMALMAALGITLEELLAYPGLTDVLLYHVVEAQALSTDLIDGQQITTLLGADVQVTITGDGVFINQAQVIVADLVADNGVVHVIDAVLLPEEDEELPETVVDIIVESEVHTLLELAVGAAGLVDALSGEGPFTVFAPTDDAIVALTVALGITADDLLALPNLGEILQYHVVAAEAYSDDLIDGQTLTTLEGSDVTVTIGDAGVMINEAMVIIADLEADNGVVHVIDAVLIPTATNVLETATLDFTVYPNPASAGVLNVQGSWNANASIQIWNAAGQLVQTDQTLQNQHVISTEGLSSGLYTLRVLSGTSSGQKMFLVD